jgi:hypothetical protein
MRTSSVDKFKSVYYVEVSLLVDIMLTVITDGLPFKKRKILTHQYSPLL